MDDKQRLREAKKHLKELEAQVSEYVSRRKSWSPADFGRDPKFNQLTKRLNNARTVVNQLKERLRKKR